MAIRILFDNNHIPRTPTFVLANRNGNKLGIIPAININLSDHLNDASEIQFRVQRDMDGSRVELWDDIVDFKLIWCPEWDQWFEISVEVNDGDSVSKSVTGKALGEAELSQVYLYNVEINTESDIAHDDYVVTVLYNETNPKGSLLNRIMEKVPHYNIGHVDSSIANLQRTFSFDGTTILDAFNEIAEEMDCLFVIDSGSNMDGSISRTVNVYDMESVCRNCGFRGVFSGACPDCGSDDARYGYGEDTNIYVSSENLTDEITYASNVDSVKNCFRLVGGDDLMTATIANCNPNGSGYLWYFSDAMREDMSEALKARLTAYDNEYADYSSSHAFAIPASMVMRYNALVTKYRPYRSTLNTISTTVTGYSALMNLFYDTIDFDMLLRNELMPSVELSTKTAATEAARLTAARLSPTAVVSLENISESTASSAVLALAKQSVDGNFQVKVSNSSLSGTTWTGNFKVTNYSDDEDTATSSMISVTLTDDQETYLEQRIDKILADGDKEIVDISDLFKASQSTFENEIKKYCLNSLNSMRDICQSCMDLLIENGVADEDKWATEETDLYTVIYLPYYNKYNALVAEVALRESEIATVVGKFDENGGVLEDGLQTIVVQHNSAAQEHLDFEAFLGTTLMRELASYRREDTYENSNFISDGLNNQEVFARALEFIDLAKKEIYKSATLQHTITSNLKNLLVMREFASLTNQFEVGNWLSVGVDDKVYRLRLVTYEIDFDDIENINVEFSDVVETPSGASDIESILSSASSMATSFESVKRQAKRGDQSHATLTDYMERGLALTNMKIVSSADNQNVTIDQHGVLCREAVPYNEDYDERQLKIINRGLYLTKDGWRTSTAGIGDFIYYDPEDGEMKQDYGVVADVLMGNYILGEKFGIYNENSTVKIDKNGLTIIAQPESEEGAGNETVFRVRRAVDGGDPENVIWFDADGHAHFSGDFTLSSTVGDRTVEDLLDQVDSTLIEVDVEYCQNQSRTVPPADDDSGWQTTAPEWRAGYYIWQRTKTVTAGSDEPEYTDPVCISGIDGASSTISSIEYAQGNNGTSAPATGWQSSVPNVPQGKWLWVRTTYSDGSIATSCSYMGTDGEDGNSVAVQSVTKVGGVTTVVLVDTDGNTDTLTIADGEDGDNGTPGASGYVHVAWANSADGSSGFSTSVSTGKKYLGVYTDNTLADSTNYRDYSWSLIKGTDGTSVTVSSIQYASGTSGTSAPSSGWQSTVPSVAQGRWLWVKTTYSDNTTATTCSYIGTDGEDGKSVAIQSTSKINGVTTVVLTDSDGSTKTLTIADGEDGDNGTPGASGYVHVAWANSADGSSGFSTSVSTGKKYLGVYTDNTAADSTNYRSYSWSLIKGADGADGDDGIGVSAIEEQYYLSTSSTSQTGGSWSTTQPAWSSGKYIWTRSKITWTNNTTTYTTAILAKAINGANESVSNLNTSLNQQEIFNRLTNNSSNEGIYLSGGHLYVNASLIKTGTLDASDITVTNLSANSINTGKLSATYIEGGTLDASKMTVSNLSANSITSGSLSAVNIKLGNANDSYGTLTSYDSNGTAIMWLDKSGLVLKSKSEIKIANAVSSRNSISLYPSITDSFYSNAIVNEYKLNSTTNYYCSLEPHGLYMSRNSSNYIHWLELGLGNIDYSYSAKSGGAYTVQRQFKVDLSAHKISWTGELELTTPLAVTSGGTGGANRKTAIDNLAFLGNNITSSTSADTRAFWAEKGTGYAWYSALDRVNGQPNQWGYLFSFINVNEVYQLWFPMGMTSVSRGIFVRSGNSSTTAMPAFEMMSRPILTKTMTSQTTNSNGNISFDLAASTYVVIGAYASGNYGVIPYTNSSGVWGGKFYKVDTSSLTPATNVSGLTVNVLYMRLAI